MDLKILVGEAFEYDKKEVLEKMAVHIFSVSKTNYQICIQRGLVAIPEAKDGRSHDNISDGLISRLAAVKENDYILMYILGEKELRGVWQAEGAPFFDETTVWTDRTYPFRCKIKYTSYFFDNPLLLDDINDLRNLGKIWTWALKRPTGANAMFSISNNEFQILLLEFMKKNPFSLKKAIIPAPYPYHEANLINYLHISDNTPKYEFTIMAMLNQAFSRGDFSELFGNYTDCLCYVPTGLEKEMDFLLLYASPIDNNVVVSYDIIEVKRNEFDLEALKQLIGYESWFLQKKVAGDINMVRTTAIAKSYTPEVLDYVEKRRVIENKPIKLLTYSCVDRSLLLVSSN